MHARQTYLAACRPCHGSCPRRKYSSTYVNPSRSSLRPCSNPKCVFTEAYRAVPVCQARVRINVWLVVACAQQTRGGGGQETRRLGHARRRANSAAQRWPTALHKDRPQRAAQRALHNDRPQRCTASAAQRFPSLLSYPQLSSETTYLGVSFSNGVYSRQSEVPRSLRVSHLALGVSHAFRASTGCGR